MRDYAVKVKPPRTVFLRWPFGHPLGEPGNRLQQRAVLAAAFNALCTITAPGSIIDLPYRWRRERYTEHTVQELLLGCSVVPGG